MRACHCSTVMAYFLLSLLYKWSNFSCCVKCQMSLWRPRLRHRTQNFFRLFYKVTRRRRDAVRPLLQIEKMSIRDTRGEDAADKRGRDRFILCAVSSWEQHSQRFLRVQAAVWGLGNGPGAPLSQRGGPGRTKAATVRATSSHQVIRHKGINPDFT